MVDVEFSDVADVIAPYVDDPTPGKFGKVQRVRVKYEDIWLMLQILQNANLDGNMRVYRAGTNIRIMPPYYKTESTREV